MKWWIVVRHPKIKKQVNLYVDDKRKQELQTRLYSQGKTLQDSILMEANFIIDNDIPLNNPVDAFRNIREKLIDKYGTLKNAAECVGLSPGMLRNTLHFLETKKNYQPSKSTTSKLLELLEK